MTQPSDPQPVDVGMIREDAKQLCASLEKNVPLRFRGGWCWKYGEHVPALLAAWEAAEARAAAAEGALEDAEAKLDAISGVVRVAMSDSSSVWDDETWFEQIGRLAAPSPQPAAGSRDHG